jgi:hypothetical protein
LNLSGRFAFQNDLSITKGRHNIKMGVFLEYNRKTEPGSADYMGNFNFGHNADNPLSTGNGYANMLLGVFTTYTELTNRVDRDVRHWQNDGYIQDNWRVNPRLTVDYWLRLQHSGSYFEVNEMNSGFFADQWNRAQAARVYRLVCMDGRPGDQTCAANLQRTIDPANPGTLHPAAFNGTIVPGSGVTINGVRTGGIEGRKDGTYFTFPYLNLAPRAGFAWNVFGDGKTAVRASWPRSTTSGQPDRAIWWRVPRTYSSPGTSNRSRSRTTSMSPSREISASAPRPRSPTSGTLRTNLVEPSTSIACRSTSTAIRSTW